MRFAYSDGPWPLLAGTFGMLVVDATLGFGVIPGSSPPPLEIHRARGPIAGSNKHENQSFCTVGHKFNWSSALMMPLG